MKSNQEILMFSEQEMLRLKYKSHTISNYNRSAKQLSDFTNDRPYTKISFEEIKAFFDFLQTRLGHKPKTVHQAIYALAFLYNKVLKIKYDFDAIPREKPNYIDIPSTLSKDEVVRILNSIDNFKLRTIIALIYSSGLKATQVINIRVTDIDFSRKRLRISSEDRRDSVYTVLSESLIPQLKEYLKKFKPEKFLLEGNKPGQKYSSIRWVQHTFSQAVAKAGIQKPATINDLRDSFIIHLYEFGFPFKDIFALTGVSNSRTFMRYSLAVPSSKKEIVSPLDIITSTEYLETIDSVLISNTLPRITDEDEREYFVEAETCFRAGALRSTVIILWLAAMRNIQRRIIALKKQFNVEVKRHDPRARDVDNLDDFAYIKDKTVILTAQTMALFSKPQKETLEECLNLRNRCGHPGNYAPQKQRLLGYIEDIIQVLYN
jgi:site-specific recombinase XerD